MTVKRAAMFSRCDWYKLALSSGASSGQKTWGGHAWRARGARAYNGCLGVEPPVESRGRALVKGLGVKPPPEAENLLPFGAQRKQQICLILRILQTP